MQSGMGFLSGWLIAVLGERRVILMGGALGAVALALASCATELWELYVTYGVMLGLACSWIWQPCVLVVQRWFTRRRALASSLASSGAGVGTLCLGPGLAALIRHFGWQAAFRCLAGGIAALSCVVAALCRPPRLGDASGRRQSVPYLWTDGHHMPLLRRRPLLLMMFACGVGGLGWAVLAVHLVQHAKGRGVAEGQLPSLVSAIGIGLLCGRIPVGWLADKSGKRIRVFALVSATMGAANFWAAFVGSYEALLGAGTLFGFSAGAFVALIPTAVKEFTCIEALPQAAGLVYTAWGWAMALGPPLAGWMYDAIAPPSYAPGFCLAGSELVASALLLLGLDALVAAEQRDAAEAEVAAAEAEVVAAEEGRTE
mmetsp:Transcript_115755/g.323721  ORF Transcript_115755/g.323721 Transcript_115755/m.323721 type:complete len:371 (-) Transcript_115755:266-1378(-)